ncbi:MAG: D-alanyl-D-alanine carboxypeptidase family protein [Acutalibacteraceae bacterium]|nr:D-alanyl-D-alanine carboxypeptidase family protein [Acutalibacteraceae bacterium]
MKKKLSVLFSLVMIVIIVSLSVIPVGAVKNNIDFTPKTDILYLVNLDTDTVVYSRNSDKKCYPASTTKIMTYIVVTEKVKNLQDTKVEIKQDLLDQLNGTGSSLSGLSEYVDKELSVFQLLHCMMVSSGNDAALVLADFVGDGDVKSFVKTMNEKAKELGCKNTNFVNPHGLHDDKQYTTAEDMLKIARYALTTPYFVDVTDTAEYYIDGDDEEPLVNTNKMINPDEEDYYYEYAKGIKTGTTDEAGHCLVSTSLKDDVTYMCIAFNAPCYDDDGYELETNYAILESKKLYEWTYENVTMNEILGKDDKVATVDVNYGDNAEEVALVPEFSYSTMLAKNVKESDIKITAKCQEVIDAPVKKGTVLGTATIQYNGEELAKVNLVAAENVEKSEFSYFMAVAKNVVTSSAFVITVISVVVLFIIFVVIMIILSKKKNSEIDRF